MGFVVFPIAIALGSLATWGAWSLLKLARAEADRATVGVPVAVFFFAVALVVFITVYALLWKRTGACGLDLGALGGGRSWQRVRRGFCPEEASSCSGRSFSAW